MIPKPAPLRLLMCPRSCNTFSGRILHFDWCRMKYYRDRCQEKTNMTEGNLRSSLPLLTRILHFMTVLPVARVADPMAHDFRCILTATKALGSMVWISGIIDFVTVELFFVALTQICTSYTFTLRCRANNGSIHQGSKCFTG
jgi:hypothetical protein